DANGIEVASAADWKDKILTDASGACPSLPMEPSQRIATFSKQLGDLGPSCGYAIVAAEGTVTWGAIAPSLAALESEVGLVPLVLEAEANVVGSCATRYTL